MLIDSLGDLSPLALLDIGTGSGIIASFFNQRVRELKSVDVVDERIERDFDYTRVDSEELPFDDASFDVVLSNHVIEHVLDADRHLAEIRRVLNPRGIVYLAMPNKWALMEPHFRLPFLSWLPQPLADLYVRISRRGDRYDVSPLSFHELTGRSDRQCLAVEDRSCGLVAERLGFAGRVATPILPLVRPVFPSFVTILTPTRGSEC